MINFFEPLEEKTSPFSKFEPIDWYNIAQLYQIYKEKPGVLLLIPEELLHTTNYFFQLTHYFRADIVYNYFNIDIKEDPEVVKKAFSYFADSGKLFILPKYIFSDPDYMLEALTKKPYYYDSIDECLKSNVTFHCKLLENQLNKFEFEKAPSSLYTSYEFLSIASYLVKEDKLHLYNIINFLEPTLKEILNNTPSEYRGEMFNRTILKRKLESEINQSLKQNRLVKI